MAASKKFATPSGKPAEVDLPHREEAFCFAAQAPPEEPPLSKLCGSCHNCCAEPMGEGVLELQHCGIIRPGRLFRRRRECKPNSPSKTTGETSSTTPPGRHFRQPVCRKTSGNRSRSRCVPLPGVAGRTRVMPGTIQTLLIPEPRGSSHRLQLHLLL
jgi:hypothetical protein